MNRFSHEPWLLWISNADMNKYHGSSAQQDSGDVLSKQKHLPGCCCVGADLYSWKRSKELALGKVD